MRIRLHAHRRKDSRVLGADEKGWPDEKKALTVSGDEVEVGFFGDEGGLQRLELVQDDITEGLHPWSPAGDDARS